MVGEVTSQPFPLSLSVISSDSACQQVRASGAAFSWVLVRGAGRLKLIDTERHETDMLTSGICCSNLVSGRTGWSKNVCNLSPYENKFPASESTSPELSIFFFRRRGLGDLLGDIDQSQFGDLQTQNQNKNASEENELVKNHSVTFPIKIIELEYAYLTYFAF